jgi:putative nucleotidyltransferase with HDIG domain
MNAARHPPSPALLRDPLFRFRLIVPIAVTALFTLILYPSLMVTKLTYTVGDVAEKDIKAPKDFLVEDQAATEIKRLQAVQNVLTVYDNDPDLVHRLVQMVDGTFTDMRALRQAAAESRSLAPSAAATPPADDTRTGLATSAEEARKVFEDKLGIRIGKGAFMALEAEGFSKRIAEAIGEILQKTLENGIVASKDVMLKDFEKGIVLREVRTKDERVVRDARQFYGLDQAKALVRSIGQPALRDLDYAMTNLVVDLSQRLTQPNITLNRNETEDRKHQAAAEIKPVLYRVKAGEMLLREGERVADLHMLKLRALESQTQPEHFFLGTLGAAAVILSLITFTYWLFLKRGLRRSRTPAKDILLMACMFLFFQLLAPALSSFLELVLRNSQYAIPVWTAVFAVPLVAAPMTICVFLGLPAALPFAVVTAFGAALALGNSLPMCVYYLVTGSMGAYWIRNCRERKVFVTAGAKTGLLSVILAAAAGCFLPEFSWTGLLWSSVFAFLGGIGSGVLTGGIVPLTEIAFGYTTDISLLELANLDRPVLRQLMMEAPGTYHHSVIVASMAEAAAAEIDANPLLGKVAGYYHDIGKIRKPLYFIENQRNGKNRHDKLAPSMSSLILTAHIKDGVEAAREHKLAPVIIDAIRQHHGTSLIRYFFEKARQLKGEDQVKENDFRYPGPKPQTREAALVMLADVVEAASRTLENPTPGRIKGQVQDLINRVLADGQLDECDITIKDIHRIAASFTTILNGIHHHRIEYVEHRAVAGETGKGRPRHGHSDRQPPKASQDLPEEDPAGSPNSVRRFKAS